MSRPLSPSSKIRDRVDVYLTPAERNAIAAKAETAGLPISTFLRKSALSQQIKAPPKFAVEKWAELARLGSNLIQIAKAVNSGQKLPFEPFILLDLEKAIDELRDQLLSGSAPGAPLDEGGTK